MADSVGLQKSALEQQDKYNPTVTVPAEYSIGPVPIKLKPTPLYSVPPIDTTMPKVVHKAPPLLNPNKEEKVGYAIF